MAGIKTILIIPARMASSRFPGKPLAVINGIAMLERVFRIAKEIKNPVEIVIATDSPELEKFGGKIGARVVMTSEKCATGMDRAADVLQQFPEFDVAITLQGDAVLTPPWVVDATIDAILSDQSVELATPMIKLSGEKLQDFIKLKQAGSSTGTAVTFDKNFNALYFSKTLIPHTRDYSKLKEAYRHIGLYAYRKETLLRLAKLPQSKFELVENLEQLRALENGIAIKVVEVDYKGRTHGSVDNPEDLPIIEQIIAKEGELFQ